MLLLPLMVAEVPKGGHLPLILAPFLPLGENNLGTRKYGIFPAERCIEGGRSRGRGPFFKHEHAEMPVTRVAASVRPRAVPIPQAAH